VRKFRHHIVAAIVLLAFWTIQANTNMALAQEQNQTLAAAPLATLQSGASDSASDGINYEVQIHLLTGLNESGSKNNLPPDFNQVVGRLRSSLTYNSYRVAATFLYRVREGHSLEVKGVAGSLFTASTSTTNPTFYEFNLNKVSASTSGAGRIVQISNFRFGLRLPIIVGQTTPFTPGNVSGNGNMTSFPVINYEPTGINTSISVSEGVPTLVGTITTSRADESYFLVLTIKPATDH
jgi:hypothetical protein